MPAFGIEPKTAAALADPVRSRILMELDGRALSPSQFADELGCDLNHVSRCFRQLETWGLAEVVEVRPDPRRGAAVEHIYKGIPCVHVAPSILPRSPLECTKTSSAALLKSYLQPIDDALVAGTFDEEPERSFGWDEVLLDHTAWARLRRRLEQVRASLPELDLNSGHRLAEEDDERIPTTVGLAAFPTAQSPEAILQLPPRQYSVIQQPGMRNEVLGPQMAKALSNHWRGKILAELAWRPMSPSQFVEEIGGEISYVARCFRQLASWGFLEVARERRGGRNGGGVERIFRNSQRAYFGAPVWEGLPRRLREELSSFSAIQYGRCINHAVEERALHADADRHLSWNGLLLDRTGWKAAGGLLDQLLLLLPDLERESLHRSVDEMDALFSVTVGLAAFRSP